MPENIFKVYRDQKEGGTRQLLTELTIGPSDVASLEEDDDGRQSLVLVAQTDEHLDNVVLRTQEVVRVVPSSDETMATAAMDEGGVVTGVDPDGEGVAEDAPGYGTAADPTGPTGSVPASQTVEQGGKAGEEAPAESDTEEAEGEPKATPAAVAKAEELGVDLDTVEGTGADGRITVGDVEAAAAEE
jgi:pyruvate/2-oxoglutarate dehydrogenase complex dihydrolipoamide acyltransferase (E2) component